MVLWGIKKQIIDHQTITDNRQIAIMEHATQQVEQMNFGSEREIEKEIEEKGVSCSVIKN